MFPIIEFSVLSVVQFFKLGVATVFYLIQLLKLVIAVVEFRVLILSNYIWSLKLDYCLCFYIQLLKFEIKVAVFTVITDANLRENPYWQNNHSRSREQ